VPAALLGEPRQHDPHAVPVVALAELSGGGAAAGANLRDGAALAFREINAEGGILGRTVAFSAFDTRTDPATARSLARRAAAAGAYAVIGPVFSSSVLESMDETRRAGIVTFTPAAAAPITRKGNPFVVRTTSTQAASMPRLVRYMSGVRGVRSVDMIWVDNDFGRAGRDEFKRAAQLCGMTIGMEMPLAQGQLDCADAAVQANGGSGDALFLYLHEDEIAGCLRELRRQAFSRPIYGESTIVAERALALAGDAAQGVFGHVSVSPGTPQASVRAFGERFLAEYGYRADHNGMQGYMIGYIIKAVTERVGRFDRGRLATAMKGLRLRARHQPGILLDVAFDAKGDAERASHMVTVHDGRLKVLDTLPAGSGFGAKMLKGERR
jgi:branched-chain amino acid transport system substrate-binding protein